MKPHDVIDIVTRKVKPRKKNNTITAVAVTAGIASAIWVALKLKPELYGPGGTKLSRHGRLASGPLDKVELQP